MGKIVLKVLMAIGILVVISIIASVWMVWKRPLKVDAIFSRLALGRLGFEKTSIPSPDGRMTVWIGGEGPCMVLLHGVGDQAGAWARMVPPLLEDYQVVIPDLPGHWKSDPRNGPLGVDQWTPSAPGRMWCWSATPLAPGWRCSTPTTTPTAWRGWWR
jgi:hypothetical protein